MVFLPSETQIARYFRMMCPASLYIVYARIMQPFYSLYAVFMHAMQRLFLHVFLWRTRCFVYFSVIIQPFRAKKKGANRN